MDGVSEKRRKIFNVLVVVSEVFVILIIVTILTVWIFTCIYIYKATDDLDDRDRTKP